MRRFVGPSVIIAAAIVLMAGSASAVSTSLTLTNLTGSTTSGIDINALEIGDEFEVSINIDNSVQDGIISIFTFLKYDPSVLQIINGFTDSSALPNGRTFGGNNVTIIGAPEEAFGQPAGTATGLSFGITNPNAGDGFYRGPFGNTTPALAIFQVVGISSNLLGLTQIGHIDFASELEAGASLDFAPELSLATLQVPEPGTVLLMGLGLGGLALRGRRDVTCSGLVEAIQA